ncbi:MAG: DNA helicase, partial [Sphingomonas sp.]
MTQPVSMQPVVTLRQRLAADGGSVPSEDLLRAVLPLMREVGALHARGLVAELGDEAVVDRDGELALARPDGRPPQLNEAGIRAAQPRVSLALRVVGEYRVTTDIETGSQVDDLRAGSPDGERPDADLREAVNPAYRIGYRSWEEQVGHHDEQTDIFSIGLILASLACGLDFNDETDVRRFSADQGNLFRLNGALHPVIASLIGE